MKTWKRFTILFCCCLATFVFTACKSSGPEKTEDNPLSKYAGTYTFCYMDIGDYHVAIDVMEGTTTTLTEDGSGALDWGEDNKGPISEWTVDDASTGAITIKAGVATMSATVKDGILSVKMNDNLSSVYALDGVDTSDVSLTKPEELPDDILRILVGE